MWTFLFTKNICCSIILSLLYFLKSRVNTLSDKKTLISWRLDIFKSSDFIWHLKLLKEAEIKTVLFDFIGKKWNEMKWNENEMKWKWKEKLFCSMSHPEKWPLRISREYKSSFLLLFATYERFLYFFII